MAVQAGSMTPEHKANIAKAMAKVQVERSELVAEARAARAAKADRREAVNSEALELVRSVNRGDLVPADAIVKAEGCLAMLNLVKEPEESTEAFAEWIRSLRVQADEAQAARAEGV